MKPHELGLAVVAGVALLAWFLRSASGEDQEGDPLTGAERERGGGSPWPAEEDLSDAELDEAPQLTVITSDGWSLVPREHGVQCLPPADPEELEAQVAHARRAEGGGLPGVALSTGDLLAARVVRGAPDHDPWRLEALGRDREYRSWAFETEEAAHAALEMFERRVVRPPLDESGEPAPPGPADFAEARRVFDETVQELAMMPESEEDEGPGEPR